VESDAHGDPSTLVTAITRTNGGLWIGQLGRGAHLRGADGTTRWVHASDGLPSDEITRILEARDGTLWIGTRAGLARERDGRFETIKIGDGTHNPTISDLEEDEDGNVWIAAFGGLARAKGSHADAFPPSAGFPFLTTSVALDGIGNVWVGTSTGVCRIPRSEFERFLQSGARPRPFRCFDESDGFRNRETDMGGRPVAHFRDGRLGFATVAGLAVVHPEKVTSEGLAPLIDIQQVEADGVALGVAELRTLAPGTRQLRVDYAALTYVAPNRVRHRYRLEGYDRDWVDAGNRRSAHYTNIPPGTYRFVVTAENGRGVWNETGASFRIQQRAHFYQTVPFYLSAAGLLLGGALAAYGLRVRQLKRIAAVLEKRVEERTVALRSALVQLEEKDARLHSDLMQARSFQRAMLTEVPGNESVQFTTLYQPTELIGGDIYDIAEMPWGGFRILLADTTGHGVQASLRTMVIKTEYDRLKATCRRPSELLGALNRALAKFPEGSVSCSGCCIDIHGMEAGRSRVVYANAAHPEVLHRSSAADTMGGLYLPSMYLGILEDCEYSDLESEMLPGDWLLLYSDGAIEEVNADGVMFGEERLREAFRDATSRTSGTEAALAVRRAITRFTGRDEESALTADDMMLLLVELRPRADT
jgi:serine phosphatase RsbU (regulator of sigma subunit)